MLQYLPVCLRVCIRALQYVSAGTGLPAENAAGMLAGRGRSQGSTCWTACCQTCASAVITRLCMALQLSASCFMCFASSQLQYVVLHDRAELCSGDASGGCMQAVMIHDQP